MARDTRENGEQTPTWSSTVDWFLALGCIAVLVAAVLLIANGSCSGPVGFTAAAPLCVGSQLSVQSWLAIIGVEFSLLGSFLLPRLGSIAISKSFTKKLTASGLPVARLLNSSPDAPLLAQVRGVKMVLMFRCTLFVLIAAVAVLYKFSFTTVDALGSVAVQTTRGYDYHYTEIGASDILFPKWHSLLSSDVLSANLVDFMTGNTGSVTYATNASETFMPSGERTDVIIGPKANGTLLSHIANGTIETCQALLYLRTIIYNYDPAYAYNFAAFNDFPNLTHTPYSNGIRLQVFNRNLSDTWLEFSGTLVDIISLSNGSLQAWTADNQALSPLLGGIRSTYDSRITLSMQYCYGYVVWEKLPSGLFELREPRDIQCVNHPFDLSAWNQTSYAAYSQGLVQTTVAGHYQDVRTGGTSGATWVDALPIITIVQPHWFNIDGFAPSIATNPACGKLPGNPFALASGIIKQARTGMTGIGLGLQVVVIVAGLCGISVLGWPALPLVTNWPGQWLHLTSELDRSTVADIAAGTSTGQKRARCNEVLFLSMDGNRGKGPVFTLSAPSSI